MAFIIHSDICCSDLSKLNQRYTIGLIVQCDFQILIIQTDNLPLAWKIKKILSITIETPQFHS